MKKLVSVVLVSAFVFGGMTLVQKPVEPVSDLVAKNAIGNVRVISETAMSVINNLKTSHDTVEVSVLKTRHDTVEVSVLKTRHDTVEVGVLKTRHDTVETNVLKSRHETAMSVINNLRTSTNV